ncbi:MAG: hypothetical protein ACTHMC_01640 [Pseudobacter sp.]
MHQLLMNLGCAVFLIAAYVIARQSVKRDYQQRRRQERQQHH